MNALHLPAFERQAKVLGRARVEHLRSILRGFAELSSGIMHEECCRLLRELDNAMYDTPAVQALETRQLTLSEDLCRAMRAVQRIGC